MERKELDYLLDELKIYSNENYLIEYIKNHYPYKEIKNTIISLLRLKKEIIVDDF